MLTSDFDYILPPQMIAQKPAEPRDMARLMVVDKNKQSFSHHRFFELGSWLKPGDLLVWNNSKVFKARLFGKILLDEASDDIDDKREQQLRVTDEVLNEKIVEIFLVRPMPNPGVWKVLAKPGKKLRLGLKVQFAPDFVGEVLLKEDDGAVLMQFNDDDTMVRAKANIYGEVPVPPYIHVPHPALSRGERGNNIDSFSRREKVGMRGGLAERYQTVYAKTEGSVAAPTAGFHFSPELIEKLERQGILFAEVTLHVGLGTFMPVKSDNIEEHKMHSEYVELTDKNAELINAAKAAGRRVIAVGTTTVRTLEGIVALKGQVEPYNGDINIFITPGFKFQVVDAMITNFHLPKSTLLMLVSAFVEDKLVGRSLGEGRTFVLKCYEEAIKQKYRFYSFGDAMFIE